MEPNPRLHPAMGARNQVGIELSYRPASLCSFASQFQTLPETDSSPHSGTKFVGISETNQFMLYLQGCGSEMYVSDPTSEIVLAPDPATLISAPKVARQTHLILEIK
jgi:hypothetical protein